MGSGISRDHLTAVITICGDRPLTEDEMTAVHLAAVDAMPADVKISVSGAYAPEMAA